MIPREKFIEHLDQFLTFEEAVNELTDRVAADFIANVKNFFTLSKMFLHRMVRCFFTYRRWKSPDSNTCYNFTPKIKSFVNKTDAKCCVFNIEISRQLFYNKIIFWRLLLKEVILFLRFWHWRSRNSHNIGFLRRYLRRSEDGRT